VRAHLAGVLGRHWAAAALLGAGAVVRVLVMVAYPTAFVYTDSFGYVANSFTWAPDLTRQSGYALFLHVMRMVGPVVLVTALQHLAGLALAAAVYAMAVRFGAARWLAVLAAAPLALDPLQVAVEHAVLSDVMFVTLLAGGLGLLLWPRRPSWPLTLVAGLLLAAAAATRVVGLAVVVLAGGYLLVRRVGWRQCAAFAGAAVTPVAGYLVWFHHFHGSYALSAYQGHFLYGRTAPFADCDRLRLTPQQRELCPTQPLGARPADPGWYVWSPGSPAASHPDDGQLRGFAMTVVRQQPGDYLLVAAADTGRFFLPNLPRTDPQLDCVFVGEYRLPDPPTQGWDWCRPRIGTSEDGKFLTLRAVAPPRTWLTRALDAYSRYGQLFEPLLGAAVLLAAVALGWRPARLTRREVWDLLLLTGAGLGALVSASATAAYHARYGLPAYPLLLLAGTLALARLVPPTRAAPAGDALAVRIPAERAPADTVPTH
jgi:4-amino-4-deoxy-L-arabinose transferase-like glycosyltransferase